MPVKITSKGGGKYQVSTPNMVHAKGTSMAKAKSQESIINAVEHSNWRPTKAKAK